MNNDKIAVIGLGYVGLPLAIAFSKKYLVTAFDISSQRIDELIRAEDSTGEVSVDDIKRATEAYKNDGGKGIIFVQDTTLLAHCNIYIITVPTPVTHTKEPDLRLLKNATETVARYLTKADIVIYESTVFPGCTEEVAVPILEKVSGLKFNVDFFCGYSPERVNPGDKNHTVEKVKKITSGSTSQTAEHVDSLYHSIVEAGTFRVSSIKIAEAAKVIENAQRDINIAFMNEISKIFNSLNIDSQEVLAAAATKWNFLPFQPGLVGGHCIGVDPYYLIYRAAQEGYNAKLLTAAREVNDSMGYYVADNVIRLMQQKGIVPEKSAILVMGMTFKENFADVRNSKVIDLVMGLKKYGSAVTVLDPVASPASIKEAYCIDSFESIDSSERYDAIVLAVNHEQFTFIDFSAMLKTPGVLFDVKGKLDSNMVSGRL